MADGELPNSKTPKLQNSQPPNLPTSQPPNLPTSQPPNLPTSQPPNLPTSQPPNSQTRKRQMANERNYCAPPLTGLATSRQTPSFVLRAKIRPLAKAGLFQH